jgi:hypothetical protein
MKNAVTWNTIYSDYVCQRLKIVNFPLF